MGLRTLALVACFLFAGLRAAEVIPPAPRDHFNDYAGAVGRDTAQQLNRELAQFERDTSNQLVVAIFPHLQSDSSIEDYTVRVAQAWGVGQREKKNGVVLFIFSQDRKLYIQVGYGLEGALPDALCKRIIANEITPRFRRGDFSGGVTAGVHALVAAAKGEYRGTGRTVAETTSSGDAGGLPIIFLFGIVFLIVAISVVRALSRASRPSLYGSSGRSTLPGNNDPWLNAGGFGGGGSFSDFSGSGGGGSFSGGGGSFGGGGAGGSW